MNLIVILTFSILLCLVFYYFRFYRYFSIKYFHNDRFNSAIMNYASIERIQTTSKIIVSISCRPSNMHKLKPLLVSLLEQTTRIDQIALNIPYKTNNNENYPDIDKDLEKVVSVFRCGTDCESENNTIPTLLREGEYGTIIIALDENVIYGEKFLETLLKMSLKNHSSAIVFNEGMLVKPEFFKKDIV